MRVDTRRRQVAQPVSHVMRDHMSSAGVMHGDGRRRGEEEVKHKQRKKDIAAVHVRYRNTTSALAAARQAVDASAAHFEQAGAYRTLHPHLFQQSFRHVGDDAAVIDLRNLLHCQLQAGGRPSSPDVNSHGSPGDLDELMARFDDTPT